jgi:hypothetical protein
MSFQSWQETLVASQVDGAALTGSLTATSLLPGQAKFTLPAGFFGTAGKSVRITARGRISNIVTTPGTLTLDIRLGAVIAQTSQALALNIVAKTNVSFEYEMILAARTVGNGTTATLMGIGSFSSESVIGSPLPTVGGSGILMIPASAPAVGTGFDSTSSQVVDMFGTWSLSNANSIQVHEYILEALN